MADDILLFQPGEGTRLRSVGAARGVESARLEYLCRILDLDPCQVAPNAAGVRFNVCLIDELALPLVINPGHVSGCYLVSSEGHYVRYCREELRKIGSHDAALFSAFIAAFGVLGCALGFNRTVLINNWLFSTSLRAEFAREQIRRLTDELTRRFSGYALVYRAVGEEDLELRKAFTSSGWRLLANRPVHWWDPERYSRLPGKQRRNLTYDLRDLKARGLRIEMPPPAEVDRSAEKIADLYSALYVRKHSRLNPWYSAEFFRIAIGSGLCQVAHVLEGETLVGFMTTFIDGDVVVLSLVGFDASLDHRRYPVYRGLMAHGMKLGLDSGRRVFLSTGAATFKLHRGSYESIEYEAVCVAHLPPHRRLPWGIARWAYNRAARVLDTTRL